MLLPAYSHPQPVAPCKNDLYVLYSLQLFPASAQKNPYTGKMDKSPTDYQGGLLTEDSMPGICLKSCPAGCYHSQELSSDLVLTRLLYRAKECQSHRRLCSGAPPRHTHHRPKGRLSL